MNEGDEITVKAYKTTIPKLSQLINFVDRELGLSEWMMITQEMIGAFAKTTDDHQWIHTDPERSAKESPYKKPIAHGFLILSLASRFCHDAYIVKDVTLGINYGLDKVRFIQPVCVGSHLRARISLLEFQSFEGGGKYKLKLVYELKNQKKPACVAEFIVLSYTQK